MNRAYKELSERIRGDVPNLERVVNRVSYSWKLGEVRPDEQDVYLESVALNLHAFYSGIERLFELTARHVDRDIPEGEMWHRELLFQMATENVESRPAVISQQSVTLPDEFRRFRHLVRNVYTFNLLPEKMADLIASLPILWEQLRAELMAFADFMEALAEE